MEVLLTVAAVALCLLAAYRFYGGWLSRRVFDLRDANTTPAHTEEDGTDYVPTKKSVVFGHHFTSIAGTGPIVGPAIAVMWGWIPALLWVLFGSVFIGAVHDLGALVVSLRNKGRTIGDVAGLLLGPRVRLLFLCILIMALWIVLAIFGLVIASVLRQYPAAITPVLIQAPLAVVIGLVIHRKGRSIVLPSVCALGVMYLSVVFGDAGALHDFNLWCAALPTWVWIAALLVYSGVASVLPVWVLLQPRDYINALQLVSALALLVVGLVATALLGGPTIPVETDAGVVDHTLRLEWVAPAIDWSPPGAPPLLPVLFITVACGACSGFHCLVGSGTTSKQLSLETDAKPVGYGSMLTEGFLATLVIAACAAGIGIHATESFYPLASGVPEEVREEWPIDEPDLQIDRESGIDSVSSSTWRQQGDSFSRLSERNMDIVAHEEFIRSESARDLLINWDFSRGEGFEYAGEAVYLQRYESWQSSNALGNKVGAFVQGAANLLTALGLPMTAAVALMAVLVASFAATTLDTSCRLQRYVIQELSRTFLPKRKAWECPKCAYDRRSIAEDARCPECGRAAPEPGTLGKQPKGAWWNPFRWIATPIGATMLAIVSAFALAMGPFPEAMTVISVQHQYTLPGGGIAPATLGMRFTHWLSEGGTGALTLWPLFGATNQLLAGFAFIVILAWLRLKRKPWAFALIPAAIMLVVPASAMVWQAFIGNEANPSWLTEGRTTLVIVACATLAMEAWLIAEACAALPRLRAALDGGEDVA